MFCIFEIKQKHMLNSFFKKREEKKKKKNKKRTTTKQQLKSPLNVQLKGFG